VHRENPYRWKSDKPKDDITVERRGLRDGMLLEEVVEELLSGGSGYLIGARGMGKSVFLHRLKQDLDHRPGIHVFLFKRPSHPKTMARAIEVIAETLADRAAPPIEAHGHGGARDQRDQRDIGDELRMLASRQELDKVIDLYVDGVPDVQKLVFLFDEFDAYAEPASFGRDLFDELEGIRKSADGHIGKFGIFAAGGFGLLSLRTTLASGFFTRAQRFVLRPFQQEDLNRLAAPFAEDERPLSPEVMAVLLLESGGSAALATYGLQYLWGIEVPGPHDLVEVFDRFQEEHSDFTQAIRGALFDAKLSEVPLRVWGEVQSGGGSISHARMGELRQDAGGEMQPSDVDVLHMLESAGLVRVESRRDPYVLRVIPSILSFEGRAAAPGKTASLRERLVTDLCDVLGRMHSMAPDCFDHEKVLPEATFAWGLVLGLEPRGWKAEREAIHGAGYTDIKIRHRDFYDQLAIIEVKHWERNSWENIHGQVVAYASHSVAALAAVTISNLKSADWKNKYEQACLKSKVENYTWEPLGRPLEGYFKASSGGGAPDVDHFVLHLPRAPTSKKGKPAG
jgi:hypothetical protein